MAHQILANTYTYLAILEGLIASRYYVLNPLDMVSLFYMTKMSNSYFHMVRRRYMLYLYTLNSKPHCLDGTFIEVHNQIKSCNVMLTLTRLHNTCMSLIIHSCLSLFWCNLLFFFVVPVDGPPKGFALSSNTKKVTKFSKKSVAKKRKTLMFHLGDLVDKLFPKYHKERTLGLAMSSTTGSTFYFLFLQLENILLISLSSLGKNLGEIPSIGGSWKRSTRGTTRMWWLGS